MSAASLRVGILEDVTVGRGPTFGLVGALFFHFRKEDLQKINGQNGVNKWANNQ